MPILSLLMASGIFWAVVIAVVGIVIIGLVMKALDRVLQNSKLEPAAHSLVKSAAKVALYGILIYTVADQLGVDLTGVLAIASVVTLAVSLSLQTALANVVGGLTLLTNHPFKAGDYVEVAGQAGTVLEVGITYTKLQTVDNKIVSLPNSAISGAQIVNYSVAGTRRVDVDVSASYDCDVETVLEVLKKAAEMPQKLESEPVFTGVTKYDASTINYQLRFWVNTADYWDAYFTAQKNVQKIFKDNGVAMSYPHVNVHMDK